MTRVAAYCRVSTDKSDQLHSFESQKLFFKDYVSRMEGWTLWEIYADEGITGTTTADRSGFCRMIDDAVAGRFELIITKEVSRFSRNILDAIKFTRDLKALGVGVIFLNDGISTLEPDAELRLGIMASVAQEESRKTSERVKWGQQRRMERGVVFGRSLLGYDVRGGKISVEPEGAELVRRIFHLFLHERLGVRAIALRLTAEGVRTFSGGTEWNPATVRKILRNEKYCGDLVQRKTVTTDFLTHRKKKNRGEAELIIIRDHHEPIISRENWETAQAELKRRSPEKTARGHGSRFSLSGKIICGECRRPYICRTRKNGGGSYRAWRCTGAACGSSGKQIREEVICALLREACFRLNLNADALAGEITEAVKAVLTGSDQYKTDKMIRLTERKKLQLTDTYLAGELSREEYRELRLRYENELNTLRERNLAAEAAESVFAAGTLSETVSSLLSGMDLDDDFYTGLADRIEVYPDGRIEATLQNMSGKWVFLAAGTGKSRR